MKRPSINEVFETVGIAAIVVSLLFLAYELRRANEIGEAEATSTVYEMANELMLAMSTDQHLRQALIKSGRGDFEALTDDDKVLLNGWVTYILNINEVAWKQNQLGLMSDEDMRMRFTELCVSIIKHPTFGKFWEHREKFVLPGFYQAADEACEI